MASADARRVGRFEFQLSAQASTIIQFPLVAAGVISAPPSELGNRCLAYCEAQMMRAIQSTFLASSVFTGCSGLNEANSMVRPDCFCKILAMT